MLKTKKLYLELADLTLQEGGSSKQPRFHKKNKTLCERMFPRLANVTDLSEKEVIAYNIIKSDKYMSEFDGNNELHEQIY